MGALIVSGQYRIPISWMPLLRSRMQINFTHRLAFMSSFFFFQETQVDKEKGGRNVLL